MHTETQGQQGGYFSPRCNPQAGAKAFRWSACEVAYNIRVQAAAHHAIEHVPPVKPLKRNDKTATEDTCTQST